VLHRAKQHNTVSLPRAQTRNAISEFSALTVRLSCLLWPSLLPLSKIMQNYMGQVSVTHLTLDLLITNERILLVWSGALPLGHPINTATSLIQPSLFWPEQKLSQSFSYLKKPFNMATLLIPPNFRGPLVTRLTGFTVDGIIIHSLPYK